MKIDGLAINLAYRNGVLETATTRGNGYVGEDITENVDFISAIPRVLTAPPGGGQIPEFFEARGEVFLSSANFDALNSRQHELQAESEAEQLARGVNPEKIVVRYPEFANARNTAAGSLRQRADKKCQKCQHGGITHGIGKSIWHILCCEQGFHIFKQIGLANSIPANYYL